MTALRVPVIDAQIQKQRTTLHVSYFSCVRLEVSFRNYMELLDDEILAQYWL